MDRTEKRAFVQALQAVFADTSFVLVSQNKGLTVADATTLRQRSVMVPPSSCANQHRPT